MYNFFSHLDKAFIINLKEDQYRKSHVINELKGKCSNYEIIEAISYNDKIVKELYLSDKVLSYPPCFRCLQIECDHENNFITPKQVANFLSFKKIMQMVVEMDLRNVLIFEDDFQFSYDSKRSFKNLEKFFLENNLFVKKDPFLIRIGSHTIVNKIFYFKLFVTRKSTFVYDNVDDMANPCFLINREFAKIFLDELNSIGDTSDNFIHRTIVEKHNILNYSIYPFPVKQLSYGRKNNKFSSSITVSNSSNKFENKNNVRNKNEYDSLLKEWLKS